MATNSYGWVNPISQPSTPYSARYAPTASAAGLSTQGGPTTTDRVRDPTQGGFGGTDYGSGPPSGQSVSPILQNILQATPQNSTGLWSLGNPVAWNGPNRSALEDYMNNYVVPIGNLQNAQNTLGLNAWQAQNNLAEQQRVNTSQIDLANQAQALQQAGFNFATGPQFQQAIAQFNAQQDLAAKTQRDTAAYQMGQNQYNAQNVANQYDLGKAANQNVAQNNAWNYQLGQGANANQLYNYQQQAALGQQANANTAQSIANQLALGNAQNANTLTGLNQQYDLGKQQNINAAQANANTLYNYQQQAALGKEANANQLTGLNQQYALGQGANANQLYNYQQQAAIGKQANANTLTGLNQQYALGQGANANQLYNYQQQAAIGKQANANTLYNYQQQAALGQGQLGYQNRQLDTTNAFNQQQLAQEAALTREKYQNDLTQARYGAFGRAQAPNARAMLSWR